jgi:hypothetical protein
MATGIDPMKKSTISRLFMIGLIVIVAGVVLVVGSVLAGLAAGAVTLGGSTYIEVNGGALAWTLFGLVIGLLAIGGGSIAALVSWIAALLNTAELEDKTWFVLLLVLGLFSFGFLAMIAYVLAGPDGTGRVAAGPGVSRAARI